MKILLAATCLCVLMSACDIQSLPIRVPVVPEGSRGLRHHRHWVLTINIDKYGVGSIEERAIESNEALRTIFDNRVSRNPLSAIGIRADARAPFESIANVVFLARTAGISRIYIFAGEKVTDGSGEMVILENSIELTLE